MKKYIIYTGILAVGLLLGWLLFGNSSNEKEEHNHNETVETNQMWTCSMHPQIMQPEAGDCPICGMDLIPSEAGADGLSADQFKLTKNAMALANIQTSIVGKASIEDNTTKLSGKIAENEEAMPFSVMSPYLAKSQIRTDPYEDDMENLSCEYQILVCSLVYQSHPWLVKSLYV